MIDGTDLLSLEQDVRDLIGEEAAKFWTQPRVFRAINSEVARLARKVIDLDNGWFETSATYTPAASLTLPVNCYAVRNIEAYNNGLWFGLRWIDDHNRGQYQVAGGSTGYPTGVRFVDGTLAIEGGISGPSSIRIQYARMPAEMRYENVLSTTSTSVSMSTGAYTDDAYNGDRILVVSGTGAGQIRTVTDYDAATYKLTVDAWTTGPDNTSYLSWLLPEPLAKWSDVVSTGAAIRLLNRRRDTELINSLMQQYTMDVMDMMSSLGQRQTDQPQRVNYLPDGLEERW